MRRVNASRAKGECEQSDCDQGECEQGDCDQSDWIRVIAIRIKSF